MSSRISPRLPSISPKPIGRCGWTQNTRLLLTALFIDSLPRSQTTALAFLGALLAAGLGKNPHGDDEKDGGEQHELVEFRPDRRAAPEREPERHQDHDGGHGPFDIGRHGDALSLPNWPRPAWRRPLRAPSAGRASGP